jgi:hypothetical protein
MNNFNFKKYLKESRLLKEDVSLVKQEIIKKLEEANKLLEPIIGDAYDFDAEDTFYTIEDVINTLKGEDE